MEELKEFIREKIEKKKREIKEEGEKEKIRLLNEFEEEKKKILKEAKKEVEEILRIEEIKKITEVERENLNKILKKRDEILEDIFKTLKKEKEKIKWDDVLVNFFHEAVKRFGEKEGIVRVSEKFYKIIKEEVEKNNLKFKIIKDDLEEGIILEREDGRIRVYNTFSSRIERAKNYIYEILKKELDV
ncbi:MAG: V-type ATP synthase subunit E family protein [candidate division WOR-3 bacterium]